MLKSYNNVLGNVFRNYFNVKYLYAQINQMKVENNMKLVFTSNSGFVEFTQISVIFITIFYLQVRQHAYVNLY